MRFKREIIAIILVICMLFTISAISAADNSTDVVSATNTSEETVNVANDDSLGMENNGEILSEGETDDGSFVALNTKISSASDGETVYLWNDYEYSSTDSGTGGISISNSLTIDGQGHTIDAKGISRIFDCSPYANVDVTLKNIIFANGKASYGGALYWYPNGGNTDIINCTFINNTASGSYGGGAAIMGYVGISNIINCTFINNHDPNCALYLTSTNVENSVFLNNTNGIIVGSNIIANNNWFGSTIDNYATKPKVGSGVTLTSWYVLNITTNGANNLATISLNNLYDGSVINPSTTYALPSITFNVTGTNVTLNKNSITTDSNGNANFGFTVTEDTGILTVSSNGISISKDVVDLTDDGSITALNNKIQQAITNVDSEVKLYNNYIYKTTETITNTLQNGRTNNGIGISNDLTIDGQGFTIDGNNRGVRLFSFFDDSKNLIFKNINFKNFSDKYGGVIFGICNNITIINCSFSNNKGTASQVGGAAAYVKPFGTVKIINSTFINNVAYQGGALYIQGGSTSVKVNISNCIFLNNSLLDISKLGASIACDGTGDFVINNCIFLNNIGNKTICKFTNVNSLNLDSNWWGNTVDNQDDYPIESCTDTVNTFTNWLYLDLSVDDKSSTAKISLNNLYTYDVGYSAYDGNLPIITLDIQAINATLKSNTVTLNENGEATFMYELTEKTGNITISNNGINVTRNIKFLPENSFTALKNKIDDSIESYINLDQDYNYNSQSDGDLTNGIEINKDLTIDGHGFIIDGKGLSNIFYLNDDSKTLILKNIIFANATATNGAAVYFNGKKIEVENCTFINNTASSQGDAIYIADATNSDNKITKSTFINNTGSNSVVYINLGSNDINVSNSIFMNNNAEYNLKASGNVIADYNWWGNTNENYNSNIAKVDGTTVTKWLFLNITSADMDTGVATVSLNNLYDGSSVGSYGEYAIPRINVTLGGEDARTRYDKVELNDNGQATYQFSMTKTNANLTVSYMNIITKKELEYIINDDGSFKALNDIIRFSSENDEIILSQNYTYSESDTITDGIKITKTITIDGNGNTIDAKGNCGIFLINSPNVVFKNIIFKNGIFETGGAIYASQNADYLYVENCTFINNTATNTDGGAIWSGSYYFGSIVDSTFINNTAVEDGAAIFTYSFYTTATVDRCIFINNSAPYSIIYAYYLFNPHDSIFINNTGNILFSGYYSSYHTIGNNWYGNTYDNYGSKLSSDSIYKWLYLNIKFTENYAIVSLNNLYASSSTSVYTNANLPEITLNINSSTLNLETDTVTLDSTGKAIVPYTIDGETGALTVSWNGISLTKRLPEFDTLQTLIDGAGENSVIELDKDYTYTESDEVTEGIIINKNITIDGKGHTIDAKEMTRIFNVQALNVTFKNIIFANGKSNLDMDSGKSNAGGAIYYNMDNTAAIEFNVDNCTFVNNTANNNLAYKYLGGAIFINSNEGVFNIKNSAFIKNTATSDVGGAIYFNTKDSKFNLYNSSFIGNKAIDNAVNGALYIKTDNGETTIDKCLFKESSISTASWSSVGSAIILDSTNENGNNVVKNSIFIDNNGNSAKNNKFAFLLKSGTVTIDDNWWGTTTNNNIVWDSDYTQGVTPTTWLFINSTVGKNKLQYNETTTVKYSLQSFDGTNVVDFDNSKLPEIEFDVECRSGELSSDVIALNEDLTYRITGAGSDSIDIYCNGQLYETWIHGPYIIPKVDVPYIMYAGQHNNKNQFIETTSGYYTGITVSCNSSLINPNTDVGIRAGTTEGTAKLIFTYDGSLTNYPNPETYELVVKVFKVPLTLNVTNIESKEIILNVTDTIDLDIEGIVDKIHTYAPAGDVVIDYKFNSNVISFAHDYYSKTDDPSYYATGHVNAVGGGTTNLTICLATLNTDKFACENYTIKITVNKIPTEVDFDDKDSFKVDDEGNVNAIFKNNGTQGTANLIYESSDDNIFKFTSNAGDYKAMGKGTAVLTVRFAGNSTHEDSSKTLTVTVDKYTTTTTVTSEKTLDLLVCGTSQIEANLNPDVGSLEYASNNESIITVSDTGLITAHRNGTATITVSYAGDNRKYEGSSDTITVTVSKIGTEITAEDKTLKSTDENIDVGATLNITEAYTLTYSSDNESVVTVSDGKLTAVGGGQAQVTITYAETDKYLSSTKTINVVVNKLATEIIADPSISTRFNQQITISPTVKADGNEISGATFAYFIDNDEINNPFTVNRVGEFNITVKYAENTKYKASELNISVNSDKADNIIKVVVDDVTYPDNITIKVNATNAGTYKIDINGTIYEVEANTTGKSVKLAAGTYYANITGYSNDTYYGVTTNDTFTIGKATNDVIVTVSDKYLPGNVTVSVSATISGTYHVTINGTYELDVVVGSNGGQKTIALPAGLKYQANTTFADHQNYTVSVTNATFDVNRSDINLEINVDKITYGNNVTGIITTNVSGTYSVKIDDAEPFTVDLNVGNNLFNHEVQLPVASGYIAVVSISERPDYKAKTSDTTFEVVPAATDFNVTSTKDKYSYKDEITLKIELPDDATGSVTFNFTDGTYIGEISDVTQKQEFTMPTLKVDTYIVRATYNGDNNYNSTYKYVTFNVIPAINHVKVTVDDVTYPNVVTVKVTADVQDTYVVDINGTKYDVVANGDGRLVKLAAGSYYANVTYSNENYTLDSTNDTFTVNKGINVIIVNVEDAVLPGIVTVKVTATLAGTYTVDINGTKVDVTVDTQGYATNTTSLAAGSYYAKVAVADNENYTAIVTNCTFNVVKSDNVIVVSAEDADYLEDVAVKLSATLDGNYTVDINGTTLKVEVKNGEGQNIAKLAAGSYLANVTYSNESYRGVITPATFTVNRISPKINATDLVVDVKATNETKIQTPDGFDGKFTFVSNNESIATVSDEGIVTGVSGGTATITITSHDAQNYSDDSVEITVKVNKIDSNINVEEDSFDVDVNGGKAIVVTGDFDGTVSYISNDTSVAVVDENGVVTGVSCGNAKITVNATGSSKYNDATVDVTVTVKKIDANINVDEDSFEIDVNANKSIVVNKGDFDGTITFISDNDTVAIVDENGVVTGFIGGTATITVNATGSAKYNDLNIKVTVKVNKIAPNLNASDLIVEIGQSQTIVIKPADFNQITYESNNISIASVDARGKVIGWKQGSVTINITAKDSPKYTDDSILINVVVNKIHTDVLVVPQTMEIEVGGSDEIIPLDDYGRKFVFSSCNESIATVDGDGHITPVSGGVVNITVTACEDETHQSESKTVTVTIKKIEADINVEDSLDIDVKENRTINYYGDFDGKITFESNDTSIATVDGDGKITGIKAGNVTITVSFTNSPTYLDETLKVNVTVNKISAELDVAPKSIEIIGGEKTKLVVITEEDYDGEITFTSSNSTIASVDKNGLITAAGDGTAIITVNATGSDRYLGDVKEITVKVGKLSYDITLDISDITAGENATAIITTTDAGIINVTITKGFEVIKTENVSANKYYKYIISDLGVGTYNITAKYGGSERFNESEIAGEFTVNPIYKYEFDAKVADTVLGQITNVTIKLPENATGKIRIGTVEYDIKSIIDLPVQNIAGQNNVTVEYVPDENSSYALSQITAYYDVAKKHSEVKINIPEGIKAGEEIDIVIDTYADANVTVYVDGKKQVATGNKVTIPAVAGTHNVLVNVAESDEYVSLTNNTTFTVTKLTPTITVNASNTKVGEKLIIDINITDSATGIVIVNVNGTEYTINLDSTKVVEVIFDNAGEYDVSAKYLGDDIYSEADSDKITVEVTQKAESDIIVEIPENIKVGQIIVINVTSPNDQIEVLINGKKQTISDGKVKYDVKKSGAYSIVVNANETADFKPDSYINTFTAEKNAVSITISKADVEIGKDIEITVKSYENADIVVYADGQIQKLIDNKFTIRATAGIHTITASVEETDIYLKATANDTFTVDKLDCQITINASDIKVGEKLIIDIDIPDSATGIVSVNVNGSEYLINLENSKSVEATIDKAGKYNVSAKYLGDDIYNEADSNNIVVQATEKAESNILVEIPKDIKVGQTVIINVTSPNGQLEVLINGTAQKLTNGKVEFEVTGAGSYPIVVNAFETPDYKSNSYAGSFDAGKNPAAIDITVGDIEIGYDVEVTVKSYEDADIMVSVDGVSQTLIYGKFYIRATAGNHTIVATVAENDLYLAGSANRTYEVIKKTPTITLNADNVLVGEKTTVTVSSPDFITGIVIVNVNGTEYTVNLDSSKSIDVKLDSVGSYSISARYLGDDIYTEEDSDKITVKANEKEASNISVVLPENIRVGQTIIITVESDNDNITVFINDTPQTLIDGKVEYEVTNAGTCSIVVIAGETSEFASEIYAGAFSADKNPASVEIIIPESIEIATDVEITVKSYDGAEITVYVDGEAKTLRDNKFTVKATAGVHTIIAGVAETDRYFRADANETFTVSKLESAITVNATNAKAGEKATVTVNVTPDATGIVIVNVAGKEYSLSLDNTSSIDVVMSDAGIFNVTAKYLGDDVFNPSESLVKTIEVSQKETPSVNVTIPDIKVGEDKNIAVNIANATGLVYVIVDGAAEIINLDENGTALYSLENLKAGNHTVTVIYTGDENNQMTVTSQSFAVAKQESVANVTVGDIAVGKDSEISVSIPNATGNVSLIIDGVETSLELVDGFANYTVPSLASESHSIVVVYPGDDTHEAVIISKHIDAVATSSELKNITVSGNGVVTAVLVDGEMNPIANASVFYRFNGELKTATTDENGVLTITASVNSVVEIEYAGNDTTLPVNATITLKDLAPSKIPTQILGSNFTEYTVDFDVGERGQNFTVQLRDVNGAPLANKTVYIGYNGKTLVMTSDANGNIVKRISLRNSDLLTFAVVFLGDGDYESTMASYLITVVKKPTNISAAAKTFKASAKTKKYTVTLKTDKYSSEDGKVYLKAGKKITLKINGKTYTAKTNAKGQATFSLKITKKGIFQSLVKFAGDNTYLAASKKVKITIK